MCPCVASKPNVGGAPSSPRPPAGHFEQSGRTSDPVGAVWTDLTVSLPEKMRVHVVNAEPSLKQTPCVSVKPGLRWTLDSSSATLPWNIIFIDFTPWIISFDITFSDFDLDGFEIADYTLKLTHFKVYEGDFRLIGDHLYSEVEGLGSVVAL